ncbi:MAG: hypothetical protein GWP16_04810 [Nitrospirae bacterium]|nr:hypothetical protein [Nitrospirota bacterium]
MPSVPSPSLPSFLAADLPPALQALERHGVAFLQATVTRTEAGHFLQEEVPDELARAIEGVAGRMLSE